MTAHTADYPAEWASEPDGPGSGDDRYSERPGSEQATPWRMGDEVCWTSEVTGERHVGRVVLGSNGYGKALVKPKHPNLRWSVWVPFSHLTPATDERCPACGHPNRPGVPARFRANGPFCNHGFHEPAPTTRGDR